MPRRVCQCNQCEVRFVSLSWSARTCESCSALLGRGRQFESERQHVPHYPVDNVSSHRLGFSSEEKLGENSDVTDKASIAGGNLQVVNENATPIKEDQIVTETVYIDISNGEGGSEGGDDLNCTQIIGNCSEEDNSENDDEEPLLQLLRIPKLPEERGTEGKQSQHFDLEHVTSCSDLGIGSEIEIQRHCENNLETCFVCGASLMHIKSGWRGRLLHVKRCSKKQGVTAKDMRLNDEFESFTIAKQVKDKSLKSNCNPYTRKNEWHGNASADLQLDKSTNCNEGKLPSLHTVLLAGARRAAKAEKVKHVNPTEKEWFGNRKRPDRRGEWNKRRNSSQACPLYKKISGTDFVCDGFHYANSSLTQNYFLTHFHSDHYGGITRAWDHGTIYCSLATANLVNQQLGVDRRFLHPLPLLSPIIIESQGKPVTVTLLDANHCPGAVMFLFKVGNRHILHVGDFRWNKVFMAMQMPLRIFLSGKERIDDLYLDTTYCDAKYNLPSQAEAIRETVQIATKEVQRAEKHHEKLLMIFGAYTIGKERIYMAVAKSLGKKVYVDGRRYRILSSLEWPKDDLAVLTTRPDETILWVVPLGHVNLKKMQSYLTVKTKGFNKTFDRIVGFRPTGWSLSSKGTSIVTTATKGNFTVHSVPYSEHSSFPELVECIDCLKPKRIIPTVSVSKSQQQIDLLLSKLKVKQEN